METSDQDEIINVYETWEQFRNSFAIVFPENLSTLLPKEKEKCKKALFDIFIKFSQLPNKYLTPANNDEPILTHYECFDSWLLGQFVHVYLSEHYGNLKNECLGVLKGFLRLIGRKNPFIFNFLIRLFLKMLRYLCDLLCLENNDSIFKWFLPTANLPIPLGEVTFNVENYQPAEAAYLILEICSTEVASICGMCAAYLDSLWHYCVRLVTRNDVDKQLCYRLLSLLVKEDDLPNHEFVFNPTLSELLLHVMNEIGKLCQIGEIPGENDFCLLLNTLSEYLRSDTCYDDSYVKSLYCLIFQCQVPFKELTENAVLKFYTKLLLLSPNETDIINLSAENNLQPINISLFAITLRNCIEKQFEQTPNVCHSNIYQSNKQWKSLIDQAKKLIQDREKKHIAASINPIATFKAVYYITRGAICICRRFDSNSIFFEGQAYGIVRSLMRIMEKNITKDIYLLCIDIIRDILMLPEAEHDDMNDKMLLLALLSLPLRSFQLEDHLSASLHDRLWELTDNDIKSSSITNLMYIGKLSSHYKYLLYDQLFAASDSKVWKSLPVFIHHMTDEELNRMHEYLLHAEDGILTQLSEFVAKIVCALDGHCVLTKLPDSEDIEFCCRICDRKKFKDTIDLTISGFRRRPIFELIRSVLHASEKAKLNLLCGAIRISNHISEINFRDFLCLLRECFESEEAEICEKIVQITPYVLFKNVIDSRTPLDYYGTVLSHDQFPVYIKSLQKVFVTAIFKENSTMQYTCVKCIEKIGTVPIDMTLFPCISLLMNALLLAPSKCSRLAKPVIEHIVMTHGQDERYVYLKYRDNLFPLILHLICVSNIYEVATYDLDFDDHSTVFNASTYPHILKYLLLEIVRQPEENQNESLKIVENLATTCNITVDQMLQDSFWHIYVHFMLEAEHKDVLNVLRVIQQKTTVDVRELIHKWLPKILGDLLIHYEEKRDKVLTWILRIRKVLNGGTFQNTDEVNEKNFPKITLFVRMRLFGILMYFESQLRSPGTPDKTRRLIITSLKYIMEMMKSNYITEVRFKVLFTLRTITTSEKTKYPAECVQLWDTFIKHIDKEVLGPMLSTIFVSLAPLANQQAAPVNNILRYLIVDNRMVIRSHLNDLYFVTPDQCDADIFKVIKCGQQYAKMSLEEKLNLLINFSQHEVVEVKLHALKRLKDELSNHHKEISRLILASDSMSYLVTEIHRVLFEGFRNTDQNIQQANGDCLGEFGAIDPSYIPHTVIKGDDARKYTCYPIDDTQFVVETLKVLNKGFQSTKDNSVKDTFALAIQITLKTYKVKDSKNSDGSYECKYWPQIPEKLREIVRPFLTTNYILIGDDSESSGDIPHLVYKLESTTGVHKWALIWSMFLISLLGKDTREKTIFKHLKSVISNDNECMLFFLPYILLNAVLSTSEQNLINIAEEMNSIIRDDRQPRQRPPAEEYSSTQLVVTEELSVMRNIVEQSMEVICAKTVFHLLDVLNKKFLDMRAACRGVHTPEFKKLDYFLRKFSLLQLAERSFERKEYARSLLYMEEHLSKNENNINLDKHLATLAKTYVYLNDVDNVKGLFAKHSIKLRQPQHVILLHEISDQYQDAAICYQQLLKDSDEERCVFYETRMIRGYLSMNQPEMALKFVETVESSATAALKRKHSSHIYQDLKCEALWNLNQYDDLDRVTSTKKAEENDAWGVRIGQAVVHFLHKKSDLLSDEFARIRKTLTKSLHLSSAGYGGYKECYDVVIKLHILNEFEKVADFVFQSISNALPVSECRANFDSLFKIEFDERLNKLQPVSRVLQPVLNIRQTLFSVAHRLSANNPQLVDMFKGEIRKCWLKVVEIANRTRNFQLAYSNILAIDNFELKENHQLKEFFIEKAKYFWQKMEQPEALRTLHHGIEYHFKNWPEMIANKSDDNEEDRKICAEAWLLVGTYNDTMVNTDLETNLQYFQNACKLYQKSEKILAKLAQYMDKIINSVSKSESYRTKSNLYPMTVKYYGYSLVYGCDFIYQSLSRVINIWLDYAVACAQDRTRLSTMTEMNTVINSLISKLPTYYFCTAFSLIMSRLSHPNKECFDRLHRIIVKCLNDFPNQILWQFMSLLKTKNRELVERCKKILNSPELNHMTPFILKFEQMFEQFSQLCRASRSGSHTSGATTLKNLTRRTPLPLLTGKAQFDNDILIPAQKYLTIVLPRSPNSEQATASHNPYPEKMVFISHIKDEVHIYSSLQKPIRVTMVGTDGNDYVMIFKAYDDMRIDCRCVEFNSVVNMYLKRDVEARDRALHIRTYTVLPLLENTGIIEFIPNLLSIRGINLQMRRSNGLQSVSLKKYECALHDSMLKKRENYRELLTLHPPLLHEWFKQEFPNPTSWYAARTLYIRSLAVMSMVGYILGLGDRHNDNILLDSTSGDIIHVDLNVIFNKGELLQWPERVPFRLTHSMIKAMGPLGYEGSFLCTSEIVNRILRERKEQLVSILHMFLYDKVDKSEQNKLNKEFSPENNIKKVELRLNGCVTAFEKQPSIPLSVEGQTRKLIDEATSEDNLCQMFMGWSAFI